MLKNELRKVFGENETNILESFTINFENKKDSKSKGKLVLSYNLPESLKSLVTMDSYEK